MRQDGSEQTIGVMLDPVALKALDAQLHDEVDDLDALDRARAAVGVALQTLGDPSVSPEPPAASAAFGVNSRVIGVSACAGLGFGTVKAVIADAQEPYYRVHFDGQPEVAGYFCRGDHIRPLD
jgi:hypothetical protein